MISPMAAFAHSLEREFEAWARGEVPEVLAAPSVAAPVELARLARSLGRLAQWPGRAASLAERLGAPPSAGREEAAALLKAACRALADGVERLEKEPEAAAACAAEARSAASAIEKLRREVGKAAVDSAPLTSMKLDSMLRAYSTAADSVERAAVDLAAAAAAVGLQGKKK